MEATNISGLNLVDAGDFTDGDVVRDWETILSIRTDNAGRIVLYADGMEKVIAGVYDETDSPDAVDTFLGGYFGQAVGDFIADPTQVFG